MMVRQGSKVLLTPFHILRRAQRQRRIHILRCPWQPPGRDRKTVDERVLIQEKPGFRVVETMHDLC